jgi:hypothetical protein
MKNALIASLLLFVAIVAHGDDKPFKQYGNTKIYFSAFNSSFIEPAIASTYNIVRGQDKGLVNIAVIENDQAGGKTAQVSGTVSNIFAQQQTLHFFEVREGDAVYYLAPFEFENEDSMTFKVQVVTESGQPVKNISFQRTFHHDK